MVMTVRFPFRMSTTCEALLVSFASLPATKKPQNAAASRAGARAAAPTSAPTTIDRKQDIRTSLLFHPPPRRRLPRNLEQRHRRAHRRAERALPAGRVARPLGGLRPPPVEARLSGRGPPLLVDRLRAGDGAGPVVADDVAPLEFVDPAGGGHHRAV